MQIIESGMFACIYLDDFDQEADGAKKLLEYCRANGYMLSGDYLCEELTEVNLFEHKKAEYVHTVSDPRELFKKKPRRFC